MYFLIRRLEISCKDIKKIITFVKKYKNIIEDFKNIIKEILPNEWEAFFEALKEDIPTSIRINDKVKLSPSDNIVKHCPTGYYLDSRPIFTLDPRFHAGAYYVQEAGERQVYARCGNYRSRAEFRDPEVCSRMVQWLPDWFRVVDYQRCDYYDRYGSVDPS